MERPEDPAMNDTEVIEEEIEYLQGRLQDIQVEMSDLEQEWESARDRLAELESARRDIE